MKRYYIGLCFSTHDAALSIVGPDGRILFSEATERYLQYKRAPNCEPDNERLVRLLKTFCGDPHAEYVAAINWRKSTTISSRLLTQFGLTSPSAIINSRDREIRFSTPLALRTRITNAYAASMYDRLAVGFTYALQTAFGNCRRSLRYYPHHLCHAATACYASPFDNAGCMVVDGAGDYGSFAYFNYADGRVTPLYEQKGFTSLGRFYADMTWLCGFNPDKGEEWKVMGFAPYGTTDSDAMDRLSSVFTFTNRSVGSIPEKRYMQVLAHLNERLQNGSLAPADLAHTAQSVFTRTLLTAINNFHQRESCTRLAMAGGCMLNSSTSGQIVQNTEVEHLFIPSAPADDGTALGAALLAYHQDHPGPASVDRQSAYLGSIINEEDIQRFVRLGANPTVQHCPGEVHRRAARLLSEGKIIGWVQGQAEFGPRSLGNRSILADPRPADMKDRINATVKFREEFRPFAPSILHEHGPEYFEHYQESRYMERTLEFRQEVRDRVPAVVHVNGSGRLQTVKAEWNPRFHDLITEFYHLTGIPIVLNTSFNVMGKPIIHSLEDAVSVFYTTGLDALVIHDYIVTK